jgi:transcriptional regulator with XRE-family HTH domain
MDAKLAVPRYRVKRSAAKAVIADASSMATVRQKPPKTALQKLFLKRVQQEMDAKGLSRNAVASRVGGPPQRTFNDVMNGADPRLETVAQIAYALGLNPWELFIEKTDLRKPNPLNVSQFPDNAAVSGHPDTAIGKKSIDRKKRSG